MCSKHLIQFDSIFRDKASRVLEMISPLSTNRAYATIYTWKKKSNIWTRVKIMEQAVNS